jgi:hypothetical protein
MALIEALSPEAVAGLEAHFAAEGCGWVVDRSLVIEGERWARLEPCEAPVALTDAFGSWACEAGHHHFAYGSPAWQAEDFDDWASSYCGDDD